jgi:hypothetical protein
MGYYDLPFRGPNIIAAEVFGTDFLRPDESAPLLFVFYA